jgi:hypothetical protein
MCLLRRAARIAVPLGAVGSVGLMLYTGRHNTSWLLLAIFTLWVISPYVVLALASVWSNRWSVLTRAALSTVSLVISVVSLAIYASVAFGPPRAKTATLFVVLPPASWLLMAMVLPIAAAISRRSARPSSAADKR